jgi:hypothetical protein
MSDLKAIIVAAPSAKGSYRIGADWHFEPTVNFYRAQLSMGNVTRMRRVGLKGEYDYYYVPEADLAKLKDRNLKTLKKYPFTSFVLAAPFPNPL